MVEDRGAIDNGCNAAGLVDEISRKRRGIVLYGWESRDTAVDPVCCGETFDGFCGIGLVRGQGDDGVSEKTHVVEDVGGCFANAKSLVDISKSDVGWEKGGFHDGWIRSPYREGIEMRVFV